VGWKNVKQHYGITHYVCVAEKGICIGSGYVHDLITIADTDRPRDWHDTVDRKCAKLDCNLSIWRPTYVGRGEPFDGIFKAMADDPGTLRRLIDTPDTFEKSVTVYTYDYDGNIVAKQCEEPGWPNVTHDGDMMYENKFSEDRAEVIEWAKRNCEAGRENAERRVVEQERELAESRKRLARFEAALAKLAA
jgi:hypothetical protein